MSGGGVLVWLFVCSEVQTGFTFLVPAHPGSPGQRVLNGCLCTKSLVKTGRVVPQTGLQTDTETDMLITILRSPMRDVKQTATTTDLIEEIPSDAVTVLERRALKDRGRQNQQLLDEHIET